MPLLKLKFILTTMVIYVLVGCSSGVERPDRKDFNYQEFLETKILVDGSKVFNFSLAMQNSQHAKKDQQAVENRTPKHEKTGGRGKKPEEKKGGGQAKNGKSTPATVKNSERDHALAEYFQQRVANLKILKMFCRQGYFILEEYVDVNKISIKAECKESASIEDYNKFTKAK